MHLSDQDKVARPEGQWIDLNDYELLEASQVQSGAASGPRRRTVMNSAPVNCMKEVVPPSPKRSRGKGSTAGIAIGDRTLSFHLDDVLGHLSQSHQPNAGPG